MRPGSRAHVRFVLREPLLLLPGDRFIVRMFSPVVTIGGVTAKFFGGALASGSAGLYQLAIQVPALADGDWPVSIHVGGVSTPAGALLTVRK